MKKLILLILLYSVPIFSLEIYFQITQRHKLNKDEYLYPFFSWVDKNPIYSNGLNRPNINREDAHQFLFEYDKNTPVRYSRFRTDKYGTIKPSDLESALNESKVDNIFCGGSTTEANLVWEGKRTPDIFSILTSSNSINAARSGKSLNGCIKTIDYLFGEIKKQGLSQPKRIIIATNVNTLMNFGFTYTNPNKQLKNKKQSSIKTYFRRTTPGIYFIFYSLKKSFFNDLKDMTNQSLALRECCHGAAYLNKPGSGIQFDWEANSYKKKYYEYVDSVIIDLEKTLNKHSFLKDKIFIAIEPNSYLLDSVSSLHDARQLLHSVNGDKLTPTESGMFFNDFDKIYKKAFLDRDYQVIDFPNEKLKSDFFYDAVHLTPEGAKAIAVNYFKEIIKKWFSKDKSKIDILIFIIQEK